MSLSLAPRNKIIKFKTRKDEIEGFYALLVARSLIKTIREHEYVINSEQCDLLKSRQINYEVVSENNTVDDINKV
jgi:hypothetical protein